MMTDDPSLEKLDELFAELVRVMNAHDVAVSLRPGVAAALFSYSQRTDHLDEADESGVLEQARSALTTYVDRMQVFVSAPVGDLQKRAVEQFKLLGVRGTRH